MRHCRSFRGDGKNSRRSSRSCSQAISTGAIRTLFEASAKHVQCSNLEFADRSMTRSRRQALARYSTISVRNGTTLAWGRRLECTSIVRSVNVACIINDYGHSLALDVLARVPQALLQRRLILSKASPTETCAITCDPTVLYDRLSALLSAIASHTQAELTFRLKIASEGSGTLQSHRHSSCAPRSQKPAESQLHRGVSAVYSFLEERKHYRRRARKDDPRLTPDMTTTGMSESFVH